MRVLHIPNYYYPHVGGIEQTAQDIVESLKPLGVEQEVLCFTGEEKKNKVDVIDGIKVIRAGCYAKVASQSLSRSFGKLLKQEIEEFKPDVIHFHFPNPFEAHYLLPVLKKNPQIKLILHYHLDITKQKILGKLFSGQTEKLLKRASQIVATSPNYIQGSPFLSRYADKCVVIPSMIDENRLRPTEEEKAKASAIRKNYSDAFLCFFIGRHVSQKGLTYLIDADHYLDQEKIQIVIAGSGPLTDSLKEQAKPYNNIHFVGKLNDSDYRSYLQASDLCVFPSINKSEAFGLSLGEALMMGKPAVTFTIPGSGVNYVNLNGTTGLEARNSDGKDLASKIEELFSEKEEYQRFAKQAQERSHSLFSRDVFAKHIQELYQNL